jgi:hypothetical protein
MKKRINPKQSSESTGPPGSRKTYGGRAVHRSPDGYTAREQLDRITAAMKQQEYMVRKGQLLEVAQVEAGNADLREVIRADLLGTLPLRLASDLAGKKLDAPKVRALVLNVIRELLTNWHKAGASVEDAE